MNQALKIASQTVNTHGELLLATTATYRNPLYIGKITDTDLVRNRELDEKFYQYFANNFSVERVESLDARNAAVIIAESTIIRYYPHTVETQFETIELKSIGERSMKEYYADRRKLIAMQPESKDRYFELAVTFHTIQFGKPRSETDHDAASNNGAVFHEWIKSNGKHYAEFTTWYDMIGCLRTFGMDAGIPKESGVCVVTTSIWCGTDSLKKNGTWSHTKINLTKWWEINNDTARMTHGFGTCTELHQYVILDPDIIIS